MLDLIEINPLPNQQEACVSFGRLTYVLDVLDRHCWWANCQLDKFGKGILVNAESIGICIDQGRVFRCDSEITIQEIHWARTMADRADYKWKVVRRDIRGASVESLSVSWGQAYFLWLQEVEKLARVLADSFDEGDSSYNADDVDEENGARWSPFAEAKNLISIIKAEWK